MEAVLAWVKAMEPVVDLEVGRVAMTSEVSTTVSMALDHTLVWALSASIVTIKRQR